MKVTSLTNREKKEKIYNFQIKCYEKYKLHWMLTHGHTLDELIDQLDEYRNETNLDKLKDPNNKHLITDTFIEWGEKKQFFGSLYVNFAEFQACEYLDEDYMAEILNDLEYLEYVKYNNETMDNLLATDEVYYEA